MRQEHPLLKKFEAHIGVGPTYAAELLGMAYSSYAQVRSMARPMQPYMRHHIEAVMLLSDRNLNTLKRRHLKRGS